jgi:hypothetical protein
MVEKTGLVGIYLPPTTLQMLEETRLKLGMNRSRFIQYCITKTLQELNVLTTSIHKSEN